MSQQLPLSFSYQAPGRIWQIKADLATNCMGLEVRNQLQEVSFSYLCPQQDKVIFEGLTIEGSLLTNLIACREHILLFQQLDDLENPVNVTTVALEGITQEVLWAVSNYRHLFFTATESIGKAGEESVQEAWAAIHLQQGSLRDVEEAELPALMKQGELAQTANADLKLPAVYEEGEAHYKIVADFLQLYLQVETLKRCEYLHVFDKMVISFYTSGTEKLANHIAVFDAEGSLLLHQVMADALLQPGSETFMVWNKQLFFIENSSCLKGYYL